MTIDTNGVHVTEIRHPYRDDGLAQLMRRRASAEEFDAKREQLERAGKPSGRLLGEEPSAIGGGLCQRDYERYSLVVYESTLRAVEEPIRARWQALGGMAWGVPQGDTVATPDGNGRVQELLLIRPTPGGSSTAAILSSPHTGAHEVTGLIYEKFVREGGATTLGYPVEPTHAVGDLVGFSNLFQRAYVNDTLSTIAMRSPELGAFHVHGAIHELWHGLGGARSVLGYPRSDEFGEAGVERWQYFDLSTVRWTPRSGPFVEVPPFHVRFRGLRVGRGGDDGLSPNLEYYFGVTAVPRVVALEAPRPTKLPLNGAEYDKLRAGRWRHDDVVVYSGSADSLALLVSGAERDTGDPDRYRALLEEGSKKAVGALLQALGALIGGPVAAVGAEAAGPLANLAGKEIAGALNDALDTGDDLLDPQVAVLNLAALKHHTEVPPAMAETRNADGSAAAPIPFHFTVPIGGNGHDVTLYFEVCKGLA